MKLSYAAIPNRGALGINIHKNSCQVCILTDDDALIERRIKTDRVSLHTL
jgi:hypothetical protein